MYVTVKWFESSPNPHVRDLEGAVKVLALMCTCPAQTRTHIETCHVMPDIASETPTADIKSIVYEANTPASSRGLFSLQKAEGRIFPVRGGFGPSILPYEVFNNDAGWRSEYTKRHMACCTMLWCCSQQRAGIEKRPSEVDGFRQFVLLLCLLVPAQPCVSPRSLAPRPPMAWPCLRADPSRVCCSSTPSCACSVSSG